MNKSSFRYAVLAVICFAVVALAVIATGEGYIGSEMGRKFVLSSGIIGLCAMLMSMKKSRMMVE
jgi:hypothetical protein